MLHQLHKIKHYNEGEAAKLFKQVGPYARRCPPPPPRLSPPLASHGLHHPPCAQHAPTYTATPPMHHLPRVQHTQAHHPSPASCTDTCESDCLGPCQSPLHTHTTTLHTLHTHPSRTRTPHTTPHTTHTQSHTQSHTVTHTASITHTLSSVFDELSWSSMTSPCTCMTSPLPRSSPPPPPLSFVQLVSAIQYMHSLNLLHR